MVNRIVIDLDRLDKFGDVLWNLRTPLKVPQEEMARRIESSQSHVSLMEKNGTVPQLKSIVKYLDAIGYQLEITPKNPSNIQP